MSDNPDRWHLVVVPLPGDIPADLRVRRWLKAGLRLYGLRCVSVGAKCPDAGKDGPPAVDPEPVEV